VNPPTTVELSLGTTWPEENVAKKKPGENPDMRVVVVPVTFTVTVPVVGVITAGGVVVPPHPTKTEVSKIAGTNWHTVFLIEYFISLPYLRIRTSVITHYLLTASDRDLWAFDRTCL
jgi:hypothetical protein